MRPHRQQPTRLPRPWDSPSKNTGVGCHFLLQCMKVKSESEVAHSCPTCSNPMDYQPTRLLHPWDCPGKSTGVGYHFLLQGIFPTQGSNPGLPLCRQTLLPSEPPGKSKAGECRLNSWVKKIPCRRKWQPTPVFLLGESQGRGSLVGCRLWGRTESDTTEVT